MPKIIAITVLILCLAVPCMAQPTDLHRIDDFSKLLSSYVSPYVLPSNAASEALNVRASDSLGSLSKRTLMDLYGTTGSIPVTSLHRFYKSDDTQFLLATGDTDIYVGDDSAGTFQTISDNQSSGFRFDWITYKDNAIGCNGVDPCVKYDGGTQITANTDGSRTANNVVAEFGAPYAELNTGANLDASSWYQYKMMFTTGSNTYYSTRLSNPINTGAAVRDVTLTDIPLGIAGTTARYVYRTDGQADEASLSGASYKLAITIADNSTVTTDDAVADGSLTTAWSATGKIDISPPIGQHIQLHRERVFIANAPSFKSYFYWSEAFYPEFFGATSFDYVRIDDGDEITFVENLLGKLAFGKTNSITNYETQNSSPLKWLPYTFSFIGCPAPWSVAHTPQGIVYLSWDGIYTYNGQISRLISEVVRPEINDILQANFDEVSGIYANNEYNLSYTSIESGESVNNRVLVYDMVSDAYSIDLKDVNTFTYFNSGSDYGTLYYGSSNADGNIFAEATDTSALVFRYKSEFDAGTKDSLVISGTENAPLSEIGWGIKINDTDMAGVTLNSLTYSAATINRDDTIGQWFSPATRVDANNYEKLYWNEELGANGNVTMALRSGTTVVISGQYSSEFTDPSGSDVSDETANDYVQIRATLTTTDITTTPYLKNVDNYVIRMLYSRIGAAGETAINSLWKGGYDSFGSPTVGKRIWGINVYYRGTEGTMTIGFENERGDISQSFEIDLSVSPDADSEDQYFGNNVNKIYKWLAPINSEDDPSPIGRLWKFSVQEGGIAAWNLYDLDIKYSQEKYYED